MLNIFYELRLKYRQFLFINLFIPQNVVVFTKFASFKHLTLFLQSFLSKKRVYLKKKALF